MDSRIRVSVPLSVHTRIGFLAWLVVSTTHCTGPGKRGKGFPMTHRGVVICGIVLMVGAYAFYVEADRPNIPSILRVAALIVSLGCRRVAHVRQGKDRDRDAAEEMTHEAAALLADALNKGRPQAQAMSEVTRWMLYRQEYVNAHPQAYLDSRRAGAA